MKAYKILKPVCVESCLINMERKYIKRYGTKLESDGDGFFKANTRIQLKAGMVVETDFKFSKGDLSRFVEIREVELRDVEASEVEVKVEAEEIENEAEDVEASEVEVKVEAEAEEIGLDLSHLPEADEPQEQPKNKKQKRKR